MASTQASPRTVFYWLASLATAALFAIPGSALLARVPHFATEMMRLGFPGYFLPPFGALKIAAAAIILLPGLPRLKEWAYAGIAFDAGFAAYSRAAIGDPPLQVLLPLAIGSLAIVSWALRPASRTLQPVTASRST